MTVDVATLRAEVGAGPSEEPRLQRSLDAMSAILDDYIDETLMDEADPVPDEVYELALLRMAVDDFNRAKAPNGVLMQQFDTLDGGGVTPLRVSSDPLRAARPLLDRWCMPVGIA